VFYIFPQSLKLAYWAVSLLLSNSRILVDTGEANKPEYISLLRETLQQHKTGIHHVLITHRHHDHIGGLEGVFPLLDQPPKVSKVKADQPEKIPDSLLPTLTFLTDGDKISTEGMYFI